MSLDPIVCELYLDCQHFNNCEVISGPLKHRCDKLTHVSVKGLYVKKSCFLALSDANKHGRLPNLNQVSFLDCQFLDDDNIKSLFQSPWDNLTSFRINSCFLSKEDIHTLQKHKILLSQPTSLELYLGAEYRSGEGKVIKYLAKYSCVEHYDDFTIFPVLSKNLNQLWLHDIGASSFADLTKCLNTKILPNLTELGMSFWMYMNRVRNSIVTLPVQLSEKELMKYFRHWMKRLNLPALQSLTIHRLIRSMEALFLFSNIPVLTRLHKLDISHSSGMTGVLSLLLCHSFPSLHNLILCDCRLNLIDLLSLEQADRKGRLPELRRLDVSRNEDVGTLFESFFSHTAKWEKLSRLVIDRVGEMSDICYQNHDIEVNLFEVKFNVSGKGMFDQMCRIHWSHLVKIEMTCSL